MGLNLREYHQATKHSLASVQADQRSLDWPNQPLPFKIYTTLAPRRVPLTFERSPVDALEAIAGVGDEPARSARIDLEAAARLCYFGNGVTRVLRGMPFRAAACTGALFHIELYLVCADLPDLEAGVYHYGAHDNALRQLRRGDFRQSLGVSAPLAIMLTSTWWRNAWKYQARAYRHAFWDSGTILANLLCVANAQGFPAEVVVGFPDDLVNSVVDVDAQREAAIALVAVGADRPASGSPPTPRLWLPTRPLSAHEVAYPEIVAAHAASSLPSAEAVSQWRSAFFAVPSPAPVHPSSVAGASIEDVILRRGSSRRFTHDPISADALQTLVRVATSPYATDAPVQTDLYLIVNAAEDLAPGAYVFNRDSQTLELLRAGDFRREAAFLDLGQSLAGDAALNAYWLVDLDKLDDRGYRAAQLAAAIEGGKLYLAAYSLGLGATGLTFFDDDVTAFFSPHAAGKSVMFLTAVGHPARRR